MAYDPNILLDGKFKTGYLVSGDDGSKCGNIQKFDGTVDKDYFYAAGKLRNCGFKPRKPLLAKNKPEYNRALKVYEDCVAANLALNLKNKENKMTPPADPTPEPPPEDPAPEPPPTDTSNGDSGSGSDNNSQSGTSGSGGQSFGSGSGGASSQDDTKPKKGFIGLSTPVKIGILGAGAGLAGLILYLAFRNKS